MANSNVANVHDVDDLRALYELASEFAVSDGSSTWNSNPAFNDEVSGDFAPCKWFYRNKDPGYFSEILRDQGIMRPVLKDASGDPRSPINRRISGLFFTASVDRGSKTGEPIPASPFGSCRLLVPVSHLLRKEFNLYFTDFYCMTRSRYHYVTLVITAPDSTADQFCANSLLPLSKDNNQFLVTDESGQLHVTTKELLIVEVYYTENLDIRNYQRKYNIPPIGGGSALGNLQKKRPCEICNLQP